MLNIEADLGQDHNHDQCPICMTLNAQDTTMVITYIAMTPWEGNRHAHLFPSLAQDWNANRLLCKPNLLLFYIKPQLLN